MIEQKLKSLKGVNIAAIVLAALMLLVYFCVIVLANVAGNAFLNEIQNNTEMSQQISAALINSGSNVTMEQTIDALNSMMLGVNILLIVMMIAIVVQIVGSAIIIVKSGRDVKAAANSLAWGIICLVLSIFTGGLVKFILYIVSLVKICGIRREAKNA